MDLAEVVRVVKGVSPEVHVIADGVAYAPHLPVDVQEWGVDWCALHCDVSHRRSLACGSYCGARAPRMSSDLAVAHTGPVVQWLGKFGQPGLELCPDAACQVGYHRHGSRVLSAPSQKCTSDRTVAHCLATTSVTSTGAQVRVLELQVLGAACSRPVRQPRGLRSTGGARQGAEPFLDTINRAGVQGGSLAES